MNFKITKLKMYDMQHINAFSIVELTIIVTVMAAIAASFLSNTSNVKQNAEYTLNDIKKMDIIQKAIDSFIIENQFLPCPADASLSTLANAQLGNQPYTSSNIIAASNSCPKVIGAIPTATLGLGTDYQFDEWGRKYTYAVSPLRCGALGCNRASLVYNGSITGYADLSINEIPRFGVTNSISNIAYLILSHGYLGLGAYGKNGSITLTPVADQTSENNNYNIINTQQSASSISSFINDIPQNNIYSDKIIYRSISDVLGATYNNNNYLPSKTLCTNLNNAIKGSAFTASNINTYVTPVFNQIFLLNNAANTGISKNFGPYSTQGTIATSDGTTPVAAVLPTYYHDSQGAQGIIDGSDPFLEVIMTFQELCIKSYPTSFTRACSQFASGYTYYYDNFYAGCLAW